MSGSQQETIATYRRFAAFYDGYVGRFHDDFGFYEAFCPPGEPVVEIGCGTGRILDLLLRLGCPTTGLDISPEMLRLARERFPPALRTGRLELSDHNYSNGPLGKKFSRAIASFYTLNYIHEGLPDFLAGVRTDLVPDGAFLADLFVPVALTRPGFDGAWVDKAVQFNGQTVPFRDRRLIDGSFEIREQVYLVDDREIRIETRRRFHTPAEMQSTLEEAGFGEILFAPRYDYPHLGPSSDMPDLDTNYVVVAWNRDPS
jgi:SAM-dependent methyltransferase